MECSAVGCAIDYVEKSGTIMWTCFQYAVALELLAYFEYGFFHCDQEEVSAPAQYTVVTLHCVTLIGRRLEIWYILQHCDTGKDMSSKSSFIV